MCLKKQAKYRPKNKANTRPVKKSKKYRNGNRYEGQLIDEKMHGQGKFFWKNGDFYCGEFKNENMIKGVFYFSNNNNQHRGNRFEGDFLNGSFNNGTFYFRV
jgi:hypothetical protein